MRGISGSPNWKRCITFLHFSHIIFLWHQSSCISTLPCLFLLRLCTAASLDCLSLAALLLRSESSAAMIPLSQLLWLLPVLSWGCHHSNHAGSFLGQRLSTINVSWWLGSIQCRECLTSTICTGCAGCGCQTQGPSSLFCCCGHSPCQCCHSKAGRSYLGQRTVSSAPCSHTSVPKLLQALVNVALSIVIKCSAHPSCAEEEGPISLRWQAWVRDNVIHCQ